MAAKKKSTKRSAKTARKPARGKPATRKSAARPAARRSRAKRASQRVATAVKAKARQGLEVAQEGLDRLKATSSHLVEELKEKLGR